MKNLIENVYRALLQASTYLFALDMNQNMIDLINTVRRWLLELYRIMIKVFTVLNMSGYVDTEEREQNSDHNIIQEMTSVYRRMMNRIPRAVLKYAVYLPLILEVWSLFFYPSSLVRLWILLSFGNTFLCIWSTIADRRIINTTICRVFNLDVDKFDLEYSIKTSGFLSICIGLLLFVAYLWSMNLIMCVVSLTASNRIYQNVRSYLKIYED